MRKSQLHREECPIGNVPFVKGRDQAEELCRKSLETRLSCPTSCWVPLCWIQAEVKGPRNLFSMVSECRGKLEKGGELVWKDMIHLPTHSICPPCPGYLPTLHASPGIAVLGSALLGRRVLFQANRHGCFCSFTKHSREPSLAPCTLGV